MTSKKISYVIKNEAVALGALRNAERIFARYGNVVGGTLIGDHKDGFIAVIRMTYINTQVADFLTGGMENKIKNEAHFPLIVDGIQIVVELLSDNSLVPSRQVEH
jgi:hypothetical protein